MTLDTLVLRSGRRRRPWLSLCLLSLTILVLGWSALWLFARYEAASRMDGWMASEATHGRDWSCPNRTIAGFPLDLHISCTHPGFSGEVGGVRLTASFGALDAEVELYQPKAVDAWIRGPLTLTREGEGDMAANWAALLIEARLLSDDRARVALVADDLTATGTDGRTNRVRHAELRVGPAPSRPPADRAYEIWLDLFDAACPALDAVLGTPDPLSVEQRGVVTAVQDTAFEPWPRLLERWRQGGGVFDLDTLKLTKGDLKAEAQGALGLDAEHRLSGRLQTAVSGYESVAARLGLPLHAVSVGGALAGLLGRKSPEPGKSMIGAIPLPVTLADGRVSIGPFKTPIRLDPLY